MHGFVFHNKIMPHYKDKGFTLIELLVVISIIGLLSSVVLASLNTARGKARDASIKEEVQQVTRLMALNYSETGTYVQLQDWTWKYTVADCAASTVSGNYASQFINICKSVVLLNGGVGGFFSGNSVDGNNLFSVFAYLPSVGQFFCAGSSGANSAGTPGTYSYWSGPGCYGNP